MVNKVNEINKKKMKGRPKKKYDNHIFFMGWYIGLITRKPEKRDVTQQQKQQASDRSY